jgi:hypothetical protein
MDSKEHEGKACMHSKALARMRGVTKKNYENVINGLLTEIQSEDS